MSEMMARCWWARGVNGLPLGPKAALTTSALLRGPNSMPTNCACLGPGRHYGEWWGSGIQRGYGLPKGEKRFSLFNTTRWSEDAARPACCHVVPVLYTGKFSTGEIDVCLALLADEGSHAAPGFMKPEGVVIFHPQGNVGFKKTIEKDEEWKSKS